MRFAIQKVEDCRRRSRMRRDLLACRHPKQGHIDRIVLLDDAAENTLFWNRSFRLKVSQELVVHLIHPNPGVVSGQAHLCLTRSSLVLVTRNNSELALLFARR